MKGYPQGSNHTRTLTFYLRLTKLLTKRVLFEEVYMKGYLKALATVVILLGVMFLIGIILAFLRPNADHEKMGRSLAVLAIAIAFGMAMKGTIGKKKSKDESKESSDSDT